MNVEEIIDSLIKSNVRISVVGDNLKLVGDISSVGPDTIAIIREYKTELLSFYRSALVDTHFTSGIPAIPYSDAGYPLSSAQRRLWLRSQIGGANVAFNMCFAYVVEGYIDVTDFNEAFILLIGRHESLRTVFKGSSTNDVRQYILTLDEMKFSINFRDMSGDPDAEKEIEKIVMQEVIRPFDLEKGPLLHVHLLKFKPDAYVLMYSIHHIICDGWSMSVMNRELLALYNGLKRKQPDCLPPLKIQYKDYASWQQEQLHGDDYKRHKDYWLKQFEGDLPVLNLPTNRPRPVFKSYKGGMVKWEISSDIHDKLKTIANDEGATMFMALLGVYKSLLFRYTNQEDIIVGTVTAGREHEDLNDQIGFFVNSLAIRTRFSRYDSYKELLHKVKDVTLKAYEHQAFPMDELVNELKLKREKGREALYDVNFIVHNSAPDLEHKGADVEGTMSELNIRIYEGGEHLISQSDMVVRFSEAQNGIYGSIEYSSDLFNRESIQRFTEHFNQLLEALVRAPDEPICKLDYLDNIEKRELLGLFNNTSKLYSVKTLAELFEEAAIQYPTRLAVVCDKGQLTYKDLNEKANQLAHYLLQYYKVVPQQVVGIKLERSFTAVIAMLGVLKSSAVYLPIDVRYPQERISYMLEDCECDVVLDEQAMIEFEAARSNYSVENAKVVREGHHLAYVIYTSGSTGQPKGVMIENEGIVNTIIAQKQLFQIIPGERGLQFASLSFDASVSEIFIILVSGGVLYIIPEEAKKDVGLFESYLNANKIEIATLPPVYLQQLGISRVRNLKKIITAGDPAVKDKVNEFCRQGIYYNAYGPTESSICATMLRVGIGQVLVNDNVPIGQPIHNTMVLILDEQDLLVPVGVVGEICISGRGLAREYLNKPDITRQKFVPNPYMENERMYKTGDLGRWLPGGSIEYLGRKDEQIKIRGYRIEPGEIENILIMHEEIEAATVLVRTGENGEKGLVACYKTKGAVTSQVLRNYLKNKLPDYMIPERFIQLDDIPVTANGKVDKKALLSSSLLKNEITSGYIAPRNETEKKLVEIWSGLLDLPENIISVDSDFFTLGGNSLNILTMAAKIKAAFNIVVPLNSLYDNPVIDSIAKGIVRQDILINDVVIFNKEKNDKIFCFPPITGNGGCYDSLASGFTDHCLCSFDYIINDDPACYYADRIIQMQEESPYVLMGYSAGGKILYPIARELEKRGKIVSKIIILDGYWREFSGVSNPEWARAFFDDYLTQLQLEHLREDFYKRLSHYDTYINSIKFTHRINSDIYFIISQGEKEIQDDKVIESEMRELEGTMISHTSKSFKVYKGHGVHGLFLSDEYAQKNQEIIKNILIS